MFRSEMTVSGLKYCSQIEGVAMGSPSGSTLANIFLCYYESNWLKDCLIDFKPVYYKRWDFGFV